MDTGGEQQAHRIDQDGALAPFDLLATVKADVLATTRGLDGLAIDTPRTGLCFAPCLQPQLSA